MLIGRNTYLHKKLLLYFFCFFSFSLLSASVDGIPKLWSLESPQKTFKVFRNAMDNLELGDDSELFQAFNCIELTGDIPDYKRKTILLEECKKLYVVLEGFNYTLTDIPEKVSGDEIRIRLHNRGTSYSFKMIKDKAGNWRFAQRNFSSSKFNKIYKKRVSDIEKSTHANMEGDTYDKELMSPARSYTTFLLGMQGKNGYTLDDALRVLDLSDINSLIRDNIGEVNAIFLYRILRSECNINISALSADPNSQSAQVFMIQPGIGSIIMDKGIDPQTGLKAWRFTSKTVAIAGKLYDNYLERHSGGKKETFLPVAVLSPYFMINDWVVRKAPAIGKFYFGMAIWKWIILLIALFLIPVVSFIIKVIAKPIISLMMRLASDAEYKKLQLSFILPVQILCTVIAFYYLFDVMYFHPRIQLVMYYISDFVSIIISAWLLCLFLDVIGVMILDRILNGDKESKETLIILMFNRVIKIIIAFLAIIQLAKCLGFDGVKVIAALGVGGIALALAGKDTVENVFGSIMIMIERPFELGDWIIVGGVEGCIEHVGLRSTRLRTFHDSLIIMPNVKFVTTAIDNMGKRTYRRMKETINIAYDTPVDKITAFTEGIQEIIERSPHTRKDKYYIRLYNLGSTSLDILLYVFFTTTDRPSELVARENLLLDVIKLAQELQVEFAFPTQTLFLREEEIPQHIPFPEGVKPGAYGREKALLVKEITSANTQES